MAVSRAAATTGITRSVTHAPIMSASFFRRLGYRQTTCVRLYAVAADKASCEKECRALTAPPATYVSKTPYRRILVYGPYLGGRIT